MLRLLQISLLLALIAFCSTPSKVSDQPENLQPQQTQKSATASEPSIVGKWYAIQLQQKELSKDVCSQRSYVLEIDSAGIVYHLSKDTLRGERMGWIDPHEGGLRAFKTGDGLTKFRFKRFSEDQFRLESSLHYPADKHYDPDPIADPVTYPDGTEKPEPKRCDTEVWKFRRMAHE